MSDLARAIAEPAKAPQPQPSPTSQQTPHVQPAPSHAFDSTTAASLLLRQASDDARRALDSQGEARTAKIALAGTSMAELFREIRAITGADMTRWDAVAVDVAPALAYAKRIERELHRAKLDPIRDELAAAARAFEAAVPRHVLPSDVDALAVHSTPLTVEDEMNSAGHMLALVHQQITAFRAASQGNDRAQAVELCTPLPGHLSAAADAALSISDRRQRARLKGEVEQLGADLEFVAQFVAMTPALGWHRAFAATFDSENALRRAVGLAPKNRPYSGDIDPAVALAEVRGLADNKVPPTSYANAHPIDSPQVALDVIAVGLNHVFEEQSRAVAEVRSNLDEPPPPPQPPSTIRRLLDIAVAVGISSAASVLATVASTRVRDKLDGRAFRKGNPGIDLDALNDDERSKLRSTVLKNGVLGRTVIADVSKDATKELFKQVATWARESKPTKHTNARELANVFKEQSLDVIADCKLNSQVHVATLLRALVQADLEALKVLSTDIVEHLAPAAYQTTYDHSMRAWLNFKAHAFAPQTEDRLVRASVDHVASHKREGFDNEVPVGDEHIQGMLEVKLLVGVDPAVKSITLASLEAYGAEPRAKSSLRAEKLPLRNPGLNQRYEIHFHDSVKDNVIVLGVGADRGLQLASLDARELRILKIYAAGDRVIPRNIHFADTGGYDHISDERAVATLRAFLEAVADHTTAEIR
jgi:hypothetical protein